MYINVLKNMVTICIQKVLKTYMISAKNVANKNYAINVTIQYISNQLFI